MTDTRTCVRGCITFEDSEDGRRHPKHYASCVDFGHTEVTTCRGCVPREAADGALLCVGCIGRARRLLDDAPDLLARLRSIADPSKSGWNWDRDVIRTSQPHAPAPIGDDLFDAIRTVEFAAWFFDRDASIYADEVKFVDKLGALVLDRHTPDHDGVREAWSVQDAVDRWGVESKDRHVFPGRLPNAPQGSYAAYDEQGEPMAIPELYDPFLDVKQAAARAGVTVRAVQKWVKEGRLIPVAKLRAGDGKVHTYFRASDVVESWGGA